MKLWFKAASRRRVSLWYKHRWKAIAGGRNSPYDDTDPGIKTDPRRQRYHLLSHPETGRTQSSVCNRPAAQQSPPPRGCHANSSGTWLWIGCTSGHRRDCPLIVLKTGQVQKQVRTFGTTTRELMGLREWLWSGRLHSLWPWRARECTGSRSTPF
jgi:hypothetical protein